MVPTCSRSSSAGGRSCNGKTSGLACGVRRRSARCARFGRQRPERYGGAPAAGRARGEPAPGAAQRGSAAALRRAVPESAHLHAAGGGRDLGRNRARHRRDGDRGGGAGERADRLRPGGTRRAGAGRDPRPRPAAGIGTARRQAADDTGRGGGAGRRRAARGRRPGAGRPAAGRGPRAAYRPGGADRRVGAGRQGAGGRIRRRCARRPAVDGLLRNPGNRRHRGGRGGGDRSGKRTRSDRRSDRRGRTWRHPADAADAGLRPPADGRDPCGGGGDLRRRDAGAGLSGRRGVHGGGRARGRGDPRGPSHRDDDRARDRGAAHGGPERHRAAPAGRRDARVGLGDLHRQDRHADPQRDAGGERRHRGRDDRRGRRVLSADRRLHGWRRHARSRFRPGTRGAGACGRPLQRRAAAPTGRQLARGGRSDGGGAAGARGEGRARHTRRSRRVPATRRDSVRRTASLHGEPARTAGTVAGGLCQGRAGAPAGHVHGGRDARGDGPARSRLLGAAGRGAGRPGPAGAGAGAAGAASGDGQPRSHRGRARPRAARARRADRPAAAGGAGGHRRVSEGRDRGQDGHGRPRSNGPRDRHAARAWGLRCGH